MIIFHSPFFYYQIDGGFIVMGKILDLSVFQDETLDITMKEGNVLKIPKPSQKMAIKMMELKELDNSDAEKVLETLDALTIDVLNSNVNGKVYDKQYIDNLPIKAKLAIITSYTEFLTDLQNNPN